MDENEKIKGIEFCDKSNATVVAEIAIERASLDANIQKLKKAIAADPDKVAASQKELWKTQLNAMNEYKEVLGSRIVNLIYSDN